MLKSINKWQCLLIEGLNSNRESIESNLAIWLEFLDLTGINFYSDFVYLCDIKWFQ